MISINRGVGTAALSSMLVLGLGADAMAQQPDLADDTTMITVTGSPPPDDLSELPEGPDIDGIIIARNEEGIEVAADDGTSTVIALANDTEIKATGGFLGLSRKEIAAASLLNGLPVSVKTVQWDGGLVASDIKFKDDDMETAAMIRGGTSRQFAAQGTAINQNAAATEALRGRMGDIDKYNIMGTTNVYFDTGKWNLSAEAERNLCEEAARAEAMDNALLLVVGYTDSVGSQDYNQVLSERRAGRVVNYLQQACGWKPYRMLTPTGMADADPLASNDTADGKAQNRRVSVNVLVSKAVAPGG